MPAADWLIQTTEIIHKLASSTVKILHTGNKLTDENAPKHLLNCFQSFWNKYLHTTNSCLERGHFILC